MNKQTRAKYARQLTEIEGILSEPGVWAKGDRVFAPGRHCLATAIGKAGAGDKLAELLGLADISSVVDWNDTPSRRLFQVLKRIRETRKQLKRKRPPA